MPAAGSEPSLVTLGVALLWIPGLFCLIAMVVLLIVGTRLWRGGRVARQAPPARCADVRAGTRPVHLSGASSPGPRGLVTAPVSGIECVWYRDRVYRLYESTRWENGADGWEQVPTRVQEQVWEGGSGPFALRDESASVLLDPVVVDRRTTTRGYPKEEAVDDQREEGPEPRNYEYGPVGVLTSSGLLPTRFLDGFAGAEARTFGYRVTEEVIRPGLPFHVSGVAAQRDGQPVMAPVGDFPAISVDGMGLVLTRGGRSATAMALGFGLAGAACLAAPALLLIFRTHLPG
jgi:hypothetical protein